MMGERIAFDAGRYEAFQAFLDRWGDPELVAIKRGGSVSLGGTVSSRHAQCARRVAEAQGRYLRGEIIEASVGDDEDAEATA